MFEPQPSFFIFFKNKNIKHFNYKKKLKLHSSKNRKQKVKKT